MRSSRSRIVRAARCEEEQAFFRAMLADLNDLTPQRIYADWLDDRGDPRASTLREFLDAKTLHELPRFRGVRWIADAIEPWADLLGWRVRCVLDYASECEPDRVTPHLVQAVLRASRPAMGIRVDAEPISGPVHPWETVANKLPDFGNRGYVRDLIPHSDPGSALVIRINMGDLSGSLIDDCYPRQGLVSLYWYGYEQWDLRYSAQDSDVPDVAAAPHAIEIFERLALPDFYADGFGGAAELGLEECFEEEDEWEYLAATLSGPNTAGWFEAWSRGLEQVLVINHTPPMNWWFTGNTKAWLFAPRDSIADGTLREWRYSNG